MTHKVDRFVFLGLVWIKGIKHTFINFLDDLFGDALVVEVNKYRWCNRCLDSKDTTLIISSYLCLKRCIYQFHSFTG